MELKTYFAQDLLGNVIPNPTVTVYLAGGLTLATGLKDKDDNALTNPFTGNAEGLIQFMAPNGEYDIRAAGAGRDFVMRIAFVDAAEQILVINSAVSTATTAASNATTARIAAELAETNAETAATAAALAETNAETARDSALAAQTAAEAAVASLGPNIAVTNVTQNFTAPQRSGILTDNDGTFDLSAKQNFKCTTAGALTLTFINLLDGLSGSILFTNSSSHVVSAHSATKLTTSDLAKLSVTGTYRIDYLSDGTNVYCSVTGAY